MYVTVTPTIVRMKERLVLKPQAPGAIIELLSTELPVSLGRSGRCSTSSILQVSTQASCHESVSSRAL